MTGNVQLYLTRARPTGAMPWMEEHLGGIERGVKGHDVCATGYYREIATNLCTPDSLSPPRQSGFDQVLFPLHPR